MEASCLQCHAKLQSADEIGGRPRKYCNATCRQAAYRERHSVTTRAERRAAFLASLNQPPAEPLDDGTMFTQIVTERRERAERRHEYEQNGRPVGRPKGSKKRKPAADE